MGLSKRSKVKGHSHLQETMRSNLYGNSIVWNLGKAFSEEDWADQVVDLVGSQ